MGGRTVDELSNVMDVEEFLTWAAYLAMEPFPETRADAHVGMLMAQNYNMNRGKGKPAKKVSDFVPEWYRPPRPAMTMEQMEMALRSQYLRWHGDPNGLS